MARLPIVPAWRRAAGSCAKPRAVAWMREWGAIVDWDSRMGPLVKTVLVCVALEALLAAACWLIVRSVAGAFLLSGLVFGPATFFVGPTIYAGFKARESGKT